MSEIISQHQPWVSQSLISPVADDFGVYMDVWNIWIGKHYLINCIMTEDVSW